MLASAMAGALRGIAGVPVIVEADLANGLPSFTVVGLTDRAIQEARDRVRAAVRNAGFSFPAQRVTVNLAPAELRKEGTGFDLAIAVAVLRAAGQVEAASGMAFLGELALDGAVRPVAGVLPMARGLRAAGVSRLLVAAENGPEAALVEGLHVAGVPSLRACVDHLAGTAPLERAVCQLPAAGGSSGPDLEQVRGQPLAKRALEIAAAGGHNLLMLGPPGAGKTMLARAFSSLLPDLDLDSALDVAALYSLRGALVERPPTARRPPFRAPHHSVSRAGLIGGGAGLARPGEISLAHRGVLFLDEICEFPRGLLESLRQPLEERVVAVARSAGSVVLPADLVLIAASNPCPCGHLGDPQASCGCDPRRVAQYRGRVSGPLRDRLDMVIEVPRQSFSRLFEETREEASATVRGRVEAARSFRAARTSGHRPGPAALRLLASAGEQLQLSARAFFRVLRVARTIADLAAAERVGAEHVAEALRYRAEQAW